MSENRREFDLEATIAAANAKAVELANDDSLTIEAFMEELNKAAPGYNFMSGSFNNLPMRLFLMGGSNIRNTLNIGKLVEKTKEGVSTVLQDVPSQQKLRKDEPDFEVKSMQMTDARKKLHDEIKRIYEALEGNDEDWGGMLEAGLDEVKLREKAMEIEKPGEPPIVGNEAIRDAISEKDPEAMHILFSVVKHLLKNGFRFVEDIYR